MDYLHYPVENPNVPTPLRSSSTWMFGILCIQMTVAFFRIVELGDVVSGFFSGVTVFLGWYAWKMNMNITFVTLWGVVNAVMFMYDVVCCIPEGIRNLLYLQFARVALIIAVPAMDFLGASFAWELFKDHERAGGILKPLFAGEETIPLFAKYHGYEDQTVQQQPPLGKTPQGYGGFPGGPGNSFAAGTGGVQEMQHPVDMLAAQQASKARKQNSACC